MKKYGNTKKEIEVSKIVECREIVKRIIDYGVNENQKIKIIEFLSLELENRNNMLKIQNICKSIINDDLNDLQDGNLLLES